jgi:cobalt/nickel transport system permease protein
MHMADALISPAVGGTMWAATAAVTVYSVRKAREDMDQSKIPLMAVLGAFIFAAQMLNFSIPGTGSSGHLGGGLILAILLGPYEAFLVMASVLGVQALFFADGGLLALGCNIFNLGFFPAFIAYPFIYKPIAGDQKTTWRVFAGAVTGAVAGLLMGAFGVVLQTTLSGISELPFGTFVLAMMPIHLAIGVVEGLVCGAVVVFVQRTQPEILQRTAAGKPYGGLNTRNVVIGFSIAAVLAGSVLAWFASANPDGLEWSIAKVSGKEEPAGVAENVRAAFGSLQGVTAFLPDYGFKKAEPAGEAESGGAAEEAPAWPAVDAGTSTAGIVGAALVLLVAGLMGWALSRSRKRGSKSPPPDVSPPTANP